MKSIQTGELDKTSDYIEVIDDNLHSYINSELQCLNAQKSANKYKHNRINNCLKFPKYTVIT